MSSIIGSLWGYFYLVSSESNESNNDQNKLEPSITSPSEHLRVKSAIFDMATILGQALVRCDGANLDLNFENFFRATFNVKFGSSIGQTDNLIITLDTNNTRVNWALNITQPGLIAPTITGSNNEYYDNLEILVEYNRLTEQVVSVSAYKALPDDTFSDELVTMDMTKFTLINPPSSSSSINRFIGDVLAEISRVFLSKVFPHRNIQIDQCGNRLLCYNGL